MNKYFFHSLCTHQYQLFAGAARSAFSCTDGTLQDFYDKSLIKAIKFVSHLTQDLKAFPHFLHITHKVNSLLVYFDHFAAEL